jgi:hypothetical protein
MKPTTLSADAAPAITNGFIEVFGEPEHRVMCYSHVIRNCDKRIVSIQDKETRQQIRNDIGSLQLATSKEAFEAASSLFLAKWSEANDIYINIFLGNNS